MNLDLYGRHALVCGASEGIGHATAHELALLGADVTVLARREDASRAAVAALPHRDFQRHGYLSTDVAQTLELGQSVSTLAAGRPVQILVNNTGRPPGATQTGGGRRLPQHLQPPPGHQQTLVQALLPGMRAAHWGRIVNVVSTSVRTIMSV